MLIKYEQIVKKSKIDENKCKYKYADEITGIFWNKIKIKHVHNEKKLLYFSVVWIF